MHHTLKTDPAVFQAVFEGAKTYEIRLNDRGFAVGDELLLRETVSSGDHMQLGAPLVYTGRELTKTVSHVLGGYGLGEGWVILSFASASAAPVSVDAMLPAVRALFGEIFDTSAGSTSELDAYRDRVIESLTDYVGAVARKAVGENPKLLALDEYHRIPSKFVEAPSHAETPLTRYDLYTVTHERRIKPTRDGRYYLASEADARQAEAIAAARKEGENATLSQVGALFGIGRDARNLGVIATNVRNLVRRFECLGAIEREFFMVPGEPDEDAPGDEPDDVCLLNWGAAPDEYVEQFRAALAIQFAEAASSVGPTEAWATLDDNGKLFHTTAFSTEAAEHAQKGRQLVALMRRPQANLAAAALSERKLPADLAQAICRVARDRGHGLAIGPARDFLEANGNPQAATICTRELEIGDTVEVLPGCQAGTEDFSGRRGVVRAFECDGMRGFDVELLGGGGLFATRGDLEFVSSATTDPLMMPLPCDIKVGKAVHRKGATLLSLVARMHSLHALADAAGPKSFYYDAEHPDDGLNAPGARVTSGTDEMALHLALAHAERVLPAGHGITLEVQRGRSVVDWEGPSGLVFMNACGSLTKAVREATRAACEKQAS